MVREGSQGHSTYEYGKLTCDPERAQGGCQNAAREGGRCLGEGFRLTNGAIRGGMEQARGGRQANGYSTTAKFPSSVRC
jgi:hypothetical protein